MQGARGPVPRDRHALRVRDECVPAAGSETFATVSESSRRGLIFRDSDEFLPPRSQFLRFPEDSLRLRTEYR